jgi:serine protease Do
MHVSHDSSGSKDTVTKARAARSISRTVGALALVGVGLVGFGAVEYAPPAIAQFKSDATVETPFGRAPLSFADLVDRVKPSVVSISVTGESKVAENGGGGVPEGMPDLPKDHPLYEFFKNLPREFRQPAPDRPKMAQGSGFLISGDGYVVTNNHVIDGATKMKVVMDNDEKHDAVLVGTDPRTDIALIKIKTDRKDLPHVNFTGKKPRVGDWVIAVGNPFGLGGTVTAGIVSALARDIGSGPYDYMQIDAAVNRGNSGGPAFNLDGDVVGVNTAIYSPSGGNVGIAFAVPANTVRDVVEQLKKNGTVSRGWLGVKIQNVDEDTAASLGLNEAKGALVSEVTANSPAAAAGMKTRDAILQVNNDKVSDSRDLARKIADLAPDSNVDVKVWRNGAEQNIKVRLGTFPGSKEELAKLENGESSKASNTSLEQLGITLEPVTGRSNEEGVAIAQVDPNSDAAQKGLKAGDVILEVGGQLVKNPDDVLDGVKKANELNRKAVLLHVKSADQKRFVAVQIQPKKG